MGQTSHICSFTVSAFGYLIRVILKNIQALPSFMRGVNSTLDFEAQKSAFIHRKINPYGSRVLIKAF